MRLKALLLILGFIYASAGHTLTPVECENLIETNRATINLLVITISTSELASQFLLQSDCYGVWGAVWQGIRLRRKNVDAGPIYYDFVHNWVLSIIIFGYDLKDDDRIPGWAGLPNGWLCCEDLAYDEFEPLDICCICNERASRKRRCSSEQPDYDSKPPLLELLFNPASTMEWQSTH
ncbi:MAG: hypothetical protein ACR2PT_06945 [Endozoicomonas sp.]